MFAVSGRTPFIGRERELGVLLRHMETTAQGQGRVVLLGGEPGIGKTRLALELTARARARGWQVLAGHAYESEGMPPYLPFTEALQEYVRTCPLDELQAQVGRGAADVARLMPSLHERLPSLPAILPVDEDYARYRLFDSLTDFLLALPQSGESRGLLLLLDDLQWADESTLLLVQHLARRLAKARLLVLGTYRSVHLSHTHPLANLLAELHREELGEQLLLHSLTAEEAAALMVAMTGTGVDAEVADAVYRRSGGTPFFLSELVRHLQAEGRDLTNPETAVAEWGIPVGVRLFVGSRLARLSPETNGVLQVAAVLGNGFSFELLQIAVGLGSDRLLDALDEASGAGILREESGAYNFGHDLFRQTVADELSGARRQRLHLRAAEALETALRRDGGPRVAAVAFHYRQAGSAGNRKKAVSYARQAAGAAVAAFAWEQAATYLRWALELMVPGEDRQRCELLLALGEAQQRAGRLRVSIETFRKAADLARSLPAPEAFGRATLGIVSWAEAGLGRTEGVDSQLEEALSLLGGEDSPLRAQLLARLGPELSVRGQRERAEALSQEAVAVARRIGDRASLAGALYFRHFLLMPPERLQERLAIANEMIRLAEEAGDRDRELQGRHWRFVDLVELGDRAAFEGELPTYVRLAEELRQPSHVWLATLSRGTQALLEGRFDDAGLLANEALDIGRRARGDIATVSFQRQMNLLRWSRGRREDLEACLEEAGETPSESPERSLLGCVYIELGHETEARRIYDEALTGRHGMASRLGRGYPPAGGWWRTEMARLCQLCACLGDAPRATQLYDRLRPYARHCFITAFPAVCAGAFAHYLGLLAATAGRRQEAARQFEQAIEINERLGARPLVADSRREYAAMLLQRGGRDDRQRAQELLEEALSAHTELGMERWAAKSQALLARAGIGRAHGVPAYPDGLSPREAEVLRLIAAGKSTREMAEELVISVATIERHISNLYAKIRARSRSDATAYAFRNHLIQASLT